MAGKDASKQFWKYHNETILKKYKGKLKIGSLDSKKAAAPPTPAIPVAGTKVVSKAKSTTTALEPFGDLIPFADPSWYQGVRFLEHIFAKNFADRSATSSTTPHTTV
jgi:hypothetical protein